MRVTTGSGIHTLTRGPKGITAKPRLGETPAGVEARALATELEKRIRGEVRFDDGSRAMYSTDASNYRQVPIGIVIPRDKDDVIETVALARRFGAPVLALLPEGGGWLLVEFGGETPQEADECAHALADALKGAALLAGGRLCG